MKRFVSHVSCGATLCGLVCGLLAVPSRAAETVEPPRGIADIKAMEGQIQKTVAKVTPSVVSIAGASGVVVSGDGYVLTVAHVGERAGRTVSVTFPNGRRTTAVTLGNDYGVDAGMAKINDQGPWPHVEMADSNGLKIGQWCLTLGYPMTFEHGKPPMVRIGRVLQNHKTEIITDGTIMGGDSGAPLFDLDGRVIGIGTKCINPLFWNIHVPIAQFRDQWELLAKGKDFNSLAPKVAWLGMTPVEGATEVRLRGVVPGGAAEKAGLLAGDVLLKFDGRELHRYDELPPILEKRKPGDKVEVELRRGSQTLKFQVTLGHKPE